ncbi:hypothetical protein MRS44_007083 [Fusarium solani]|uniref:Zn(2)-C6 fungal-type domain-containing protein n=1 Tax=Fusarium solani TaxID=169388 RepID=A0A9P9H3D8_FUSSL|nr:uncharacterized protein B0J15DRAFT_449377 [Fusarium solani]KAH7249623.1 hypothetical protein B0J15DRAFT_449377 [Fusarium solani]KAJ3462297.1 hypothetical protein MRS44_007083 [Fusarium solani]
MAEPVSRRNMARSMTSCERCKRRKAKCDRQTPACQRCERAHVECEYAGRRKPGFPAGHRQVLEDKIEMLEAELRAIRGNPEATVSSGPAVQAAPIPSREESSPTALMLPRPAAVATFERTRKIKERRPPKDLVISLASLYFCHIHPWFPFLDVQRVCADMGSADEPPLLYYALFGVALPFSFDSRLDQASSDSFWKYSKRSIFVDVLEEPSYSSLEVLTVLVLDLSAMTHGPQVWGPLAVATKLAVQLKNTDGLVFRTSTGTESHEALSKSDGLFRQRLFWAIYALDCSICITTNHTSTLGDDHVQHFLPTRQSVWRETPTGMAETPFAPPFVFSFQLELFDLSRRAHRVGIEYAMFRDNQEPIVSSWLESLQNVSAELGAWMEALPSQLLWHSNDHDTVVMDRARKAIPPALFMLHGYFHALVIYVNGFMALPSHGTLQSEAYSDTRQQCLQRCLRSLEVLSRITTTATDHVSDKLGWPFAWSIWIAARFLIARRCITGENESTSVARLSLFSGLLSSIGRFWQISATYARLLRQAISELDTGAVPGQGTILQLMADLRVTTSQIEDQFRPDPFLRGVINPGQSGSTWDNPNRMDVEQSDTLLPVFPDQLYFDMAPQGPDSWFRVPLFASSAYQQFNI